MATKKTSLERDITIGKLLLKVQDLDDNLAIAKAGIKLLTEARNDHALRAQATREELDRLASNMDHRMTLLERTLQTHQSLLCRPTDPVPKPKYSLPREQHVVMYGNPVDGFRIVGPFEDRDAAVQYGESEPSQNDWWIAELDAPAEGEPS